MPTVKESKEILLLTKALAVFLAERLKDGAGVDDAIALLSKLALDPAFVVLAAEAWAGASEAGKELADLDGAEIKELGHIAVDIVADVISALKAK